MICAAVAVLEEYPGDRDVIEEVMRVCVCGSRLLILNAASGEGGIRLCDLPARIERSQPTVSHHVKILKAAGLVTTERRGDGRCLTFVVMEPERFWTVRELLVGC